MINLITYAAKNPADTREIRKYLDMQRFNAARCGWDDEDQWLMLNFDYPGTLPTLAPSAKGMMAKWYGLRFALGASEQAVWMHDHDGWQLFPFDNLPVTDKPWMYRWGGTDQAPLLCTASCFFTPASLPFVEAFIAFAESRKFNTSNDERIMEQFFREQPRWLAAVDMTMPVKYCYNHMSRGDRQHPELAANLPLMYLHQKLPLTFHDMPPGVPEEFRKLMED